MIRKPALLAILLALVLTPMALAQDKESDKTGGASTPPSNVEQLDDDDIVDVQPPSDDEDVAPVEEDDQDEQDSTQLSQDEINDILDEADAYRDGTNGKKQDYKKAMALYLQAADAGDMYAMNAIGLLYDNGQGVKENDATAFEWFTKAADAGNYVAMSNVGNMLEYGDGVDQSYTEAMKWYKKAAKTGNYGLAMWYIGNLYADGKGVKQSWDQAADWYQQAVDQDQKDAYWSLALCYLYGDGVKKDVKKAAEMSYYALTHGVQAVADNLNSDDIDDTDLAFRKALQQMLKSDGFYKGTVDGSFGSGTQKAVNAALGSAL